MPTNRSLSPLFKSRLKTLFCFSLIIMLINIFSIAKSNSIPSVRSYQTPFQASINLKNNSTTNFDSISNSIPSQPNPKANSLSSANDEFNKNPPRRLPESIQSNIDSLSILKENKSKFLPSNIITDPSQFNRTTISTTQERSTIQGFYVTQPPLEKFPLFMASINFNRPKTSDQVHNATPMKYIFEFWIDDEDFVLPPYYDILVEVYQVHPHYESVVRDQITNPARHRDDKLIDKTINLATRPFPLLNTITGAESYRANIRVTFFEEDFDTEFNAVTAKDLPIFFMLVPSEREETDDEQPIGFSLGDMVLYPRAAQSQTYATFSSSPMVYPVPEIEDAPPIINTPIIRKTGSSLSIPYSEKNDLFTKFEFWIAFQPNPLNPIKGAQYFNGEATTISLTSMGSGTTSFAHIYDERVNETFDGCYINNIRIQDDNIHLYGQTIDFEIDTAEFHAIYKFNHDLLHIECHSGYYFLTPQTTPAIKNIATTTSYIQVTRSFEFTDGKNPYNEDFNKLSKGEQEDVLGYWAQIIPISNKQIYSTLPIPMGLPYPSMTEYLAVYQKLPPHVSEQRVVKSAIGVDGSDDNNDNVNNDDVYGNINNNNDNTTITLINENPFISQGKDDNNDPDRPHPDQTKNVYVPSYVRRDIAFDDDNLDPIFSPLSPQISSVGAVQWFHIHKQTVMDHPYQTLAMTCSFQYTIPTRIDENLQLFDPSGFDKFKNQFLSQLGSKEYPPRLRIFVPYLNTIWRQDIADIYRLLFIQISSVQTGYLWGGQVTWSEEYSNYSNWVDIDYESILFPSKLLQNGEITSELYFNNPPVIEVTFNTFGGMMQFPKFPNGQYDFTNYPQQCILELDHIADDNNDNIAQMEMQFDIDKNNNNNNNDTNNNIDKKKQNKSNSSQYNNKHVYNNDDDVIVFDDDLEHQHYQHHQHQQQQSPKPTPKSSTGTASFLQNAVNDGVANVALGKQNINTIINNNNDNNNTFTPTQTQQEPYQRFFFTQPVPYYDLWDYSRTGIELTAYSSTIPHFGIINHNSEPIQGVMFYISGLFSFGLTPENITTNQNTIEMMCGTSADVNNSQKNKNKKRCFAKEIKYKPNYIYIIFENIQYYNIDIKLSSKPYQWYRRDLLDQYPEEPMRLFPVITLQVQHATPLSDGSGNTLLQSPLLLMNQSVTMSFPYGDSLAPRSSRGSRPFEWTLDANTAFIVAWISVAFCAFIIAGLGGLAIYYYFGSKKIMGPSRYDDDDDDDDNNHGGGKKKRYNQRGTELTASSNRDMNTTTTTTTSTTTTTTKNISMNTTNSANHIDDNNNNDQSRYYNDIAESYESSYMQLSTDDKNIKMGKLSTPPLSSNNNNQVQVTTAPTITKKKSGILGFFGRNKGVGTGDDDVDNNNNNNKTKYAQLTDDDASINDKSSDTLNDRDYLDINDPYDY